MHLIRAALAALLVVGTGCNLFNTTDAEKSLGRGAESFDPYLSSQSGAIALSLNQFKGCTVLPDGRLVTKGDSKLGILAKYPDTCFFEFGGSEALSPVEPTATMDVLANQTYFLGQFSVMDEVIERYDGQLECQHLADKSEAKRQCQREVQVARFNDRNAPGVWIRKHSLFKDLDWSGLSFGREDWRTNNPPEYIRETFYENAAWMLKRDDSLLIEVIDPDGTTRASQKYDRNDFLAENSYSGRTRMSWIVNHVKKPEFPGDPVPHIEGEMAPVGITIARVSFSSSTNPFKTFKTPDLRGEGVIRVTWSQMPNQPFVFPVNFVDKRDLAPTCYKMGEDGFATNEPTACDFGLNQEVVFDAPANGKFYVPGETVEFIVSLRDGSGNGLHPKDHLPTIGAYRNGQSNGLLYFNEFLLWTMREMAGTESGFKLAGPLDQMRLPVTATPPYFAYPGSSEAQYYLEVAPLVLAVPGGSDAPVPTRYKVVLPEDAKPGTYALYLKGHRSFLGERLNRMDPFFIQVAQEEKTQFPNRVGNCQICHRGVISMTNIMHGMDVDFVEGCKSCHTERIVGQVADFVHRIHATSQKYPVAKSDCTMCHLTRESAVTPSMVSCGGCHNGMHGSEYFDLQFQENNVIPNAYTNCANACHALPDNTPRNHILPE
ncbi:MAG: hypothetical protein WBV82_13670 [Myxococcaceae bacterium]